MTSLQGMPALSGRVISPLPVTSVGALLAFASSCLAPDPPAPSLLAGAQRLGQARADVVGFAGNEGALPGVQHDQFFR